MFPTYIQVLHYICRPCCVIVLSSDCFEDYSRSMYRIDHCPCNRHLKQVRSYIHCIEFFEFFVLLFLCSLVLGWTLMDIFPVLLCITCNDICAVPSVSLFFINTGCDIQWIVNAVDESFYQGWTFVSALSVSPQAIGMILDALFQVICRSCCIPCIILKLVIHNIMFHEYII